MFSGLEIALPTGAQTPIAFILGLSSELYAAMGQPAQALSMLIALAMAEHNAEGMSVDDLYRRRGILLAEMGQSWREADAICARHLHAPAVSRRACTRCVHLRPGCGWRACMPQ